jgi:copper resistance protein B
MTAYLGEGGRTAINIEAEYELLLTQRLVLQPRAELNVYGKDDRNNDIGSGLSDISLGLRLRYEFSRQFAPYIGVEWTDSYGDTADYRRAAGADVSDTQFVAGVRFWF